MTWKPHVHPKALALRLTSTLWGGGWFFWATHRTNQFMAEHPHDPIMLQVAATSALIALVAWVVVGPLCVAKARRIQRLYNPQMAI